MLRERWLPALGELRPVAAHGVIVVDRPPRRPWTRHGAPRVSFVGPVSGTTSSAAAMPVSASHAVGVVALGHELPPLHDRDDQTGEQESEQALQSLDEPHTEPECRRRETECPDQIPLNQRFQRPVPPHAMPGQEDQVRGRLTASLTAGPVGSWDLVARAVIGPKIPMLAESSRTNATKGKVGSGAGAVHKLASPGNPRTQSGAGIPLRGLLGLSVAPRLLTAGYAWLAWRRTALTRYVWTFNATPQLFVAEGAGMTEAIWAFRGKTEDSMAARKDCRSLPHGAKRLIPRSSP